MAFLALVHTESVFSVTLWYFCSVFTWYIPKLVFFSFHFVSFCCSCCFAVFLNSRPKNCAKRSRQPVYFDLLSKCCLCQVISSSSAPFPTICTFFCIPPTRTSHFALMRNILHIIAHTPRCHSKISISKGFGISHVRFFNFHLFHDKGDHINLRPFIFPVTPRLRFIFLYFFSIRIFCVIIFFSFKFCYYSYFSLKACQRPASVRQFEFSISLANRSIHSS